MLTKCNAILLPLSELLLLQANEMMDPSFIRVLTYISDLPKLDIFSSLVALGVLRDLFEVNALAHKTTLLVGMVACSIPT